MDVDRDGGTQRSGLPKSSSSQRSVQFSDKIRVKTLDAHLEGIDVKKRTASDVKRVLFERFFDPTSLSLFAPTSPRNAPSSPSSRSSPCTPVYARSLSNLSRTRTNVTLPDQPSSSSEFSPARSPSYRVAGQRRPGRSMRSAPRPVPVAGSPGAASLHAQAVLHLAGALDVQRLPVGSISQLTELQRDAATWSEEQVHHQCRRGLVKHMADLLQVPKLQRQVCGMLAELGTRWPPALAGAAADVAQQLQLPLDRPSARGPALLLLEALAACGSAGRKSVASSEHIMHHLSLALKRATPRTHKADVLTEPRMQALAAGGSPSLGSRRRGSNQVWSDDEAWGPGMSVGRSPPTRPSTASPAPHLVRSPMSPGGCAWDSLGAAPLTTGSERLEATGAASGVILSEATSAARVLLTLLSSPSASISICRRHQTAVDPICRLFRHLAQQRAGDWPQTGPRASSGKENDSGTSEHFEGLQRQKQALLLLLIGCMCRLSSVAAAGQRMVTLEVLPLLLSLHSSASTRQAAEGESGKVPAEDSALATAALRCLGRVAACADDERRGALRKALEDDEENAGVEAAVLGALVSVLESEPVRPRAATDAALVLWLAATGDDNSVKERMLLRHKVMAAAAGLLQRVLRDCRPDGSFVVHRVDASNDDTNIDDLEEDEDEESPVSRGRSTATLGIDAGDVVGDAAGDAAAGGSDAHSLTAAVSRGATALPGSDEDAEDNGSPSLGGRQRSDSSSVMNTPLAHFLDVAKTQAEEAVAVLPTPEEGGEGQAGSAEDTGVQQQRQPPRLLKRLYRLEAVEQVLRNCLGLVGSLLTLLGVSGPKRDAAAKAVAPDAQAVAGTAAVCLFGSLSGPGRTWVDGEDCSWGSEVRERALAVLSNMCLHERTATVVLCCARAPDLAMRVLLSEMQGFPPGILPSSTSVGTRTRSVLSAPTGLIIQAASLICNHLRLFPALIEPTAAVNQQEAISSGGGSIPGVSDGENAAKPACQLDPCAALSQLCRALLLLQASFPAATPLPRATPLSSPPTRWCTVPSAVQLYQVNVIACAIAAAAAAARSPSRLHAATDAVGAAALALATLLPLSHHAASDPGAEAAFSAAGCAAAAALYGLLSGGHVHPELSGLMDRLLPCLPLMLSRLKRGGGDGCSTGADACNPLPLMLLDELCRSKRVAAQVVRNTAVAQALVSLRCSGWGSRSTGLLRLLKRLRRFDTFNALRKLKELQPKEEEDAVAEEIVQFQEEEEEGVQSADGDADASEKEVVAKSEEGSC